MAVKRVGVLFIAALVLGLAACNLPQPTQVPVATAVQATLTAMVARSAPTQATPRITRSPQGTPVSGGTPGSPSAQPTTATPAMGEGTPPAATGAVEGLVWQDLCATSGGAANPTPGPNCKQYPEIGYAGDGVHQADEPAMGGVEVTLATGECPGKPFLKTTTDAEGHYAFSELPPGTYCVSVDPHQPPNADRFPVGEWTAPGVKTGFRQVIVRGGETVKVGFGWFTWTHCDNRAKFISENYPDGSEVTPGDPFTKAWVLENTGTCPWTKDYALVHTGGELMGAPARVPLTETVPPGGQVTLQVKFVAPATPGTYRSEWRLEDPKGNRFGPGKQGEGSVWVEIKVPEVAATLNLGTPTVADPMNSAARWYLLNTPDARFEMGAGKLLLHALTPGMLDSWALSSYPPLGDGFVEATFITGDTCTGLDRYGLIVRAPDPTQGVVVEFSCDGRYRIYTWDGSNYTALHRWAHGAGIHAGPDKTNRMGVWLEGNTVKLYANRVLLASVSQSQYSAPGKFGLVIASEKTADFTVAVDEVDYWTSLP